MVIIVIHWWIYHGKESEFEAFWRQQTVVNDRRGLVGEFLSKPLTGEEYSWIDWEIEYGNECAPYVNVAIWKDAETFHRQIGRYFPVNGQKEEFEYRLRRRLALTPAEWRIGDFPLPIRDTGGVL